MCKRYCLANVLITTDAIFPDFQKAVAHKLQNKVHAVTCGPPDYYFTDYRL